MLRIRQAQQSTQNDIAHMSTISVRSEVIHGTGPPTEPGQNATILIVHWKTTPVPPTFTVICGSFPVSSSQCVRYLGVLVDQHLAFKEQVGKVVADVNRKLAAFRRIRHHITTQAQRSFYLSIIQSTMEYASNCYIHTISATLYNTLI